MSQDVCCWTDHFVRIYSISFHHIRIKVVRIDCCHQSLYNKEALETYSI